MRRILFSLTLTALAACGDDGGGSSIDARIVGMDAPVTCAAEAAYGTAPAPIEPVATRDADTNPETISYYGSLNMDFDDLGVELYKGYGTYTTGEIVPGTTQLTGDEAAYETCGACVLIYANTNAETGENEMTYLAIGGTLNITSVTPNITGNILNASFVHVTIDEEGASAPAPDACASTIASFSFDTAVTTDAAVAAAPGHRRHKRLHR